MDEILHRACHVFDRHTGIDTVLIEQVDHICPESFQRSVGNFLDVLWPAIQADLLTFRTKFESELSGNYHSLTLRSQRFANELFIGERAVNFSGIEECDTAFDG